MAKKNNIVVDVGELTDLPNENYKKLFAKFAEIDSIDVKEWKTNHVLGYFVKKYKEQYGIDYKFKFNSPAPSKCFEVFQIKRLAMNLSSDPVILKEYIDWIFLNKVVKAKRRLTSISFMTVEDIVAEYKFNVLMVVKPDGISRSTLLPEKYRLPFEEANIFIKTYGELAFVSNMEDMSFEAIGAMIKIEQLGFDKSLLNKIV